MFAKQVCHLVQRRPCEDAAAIGVQHGIVRQAEQLQVQQPVQLPWHDSKVALDLRATFTSPHKRLGPDTAEGMPKLSRPAAFNIAAVYAAPVHRFIVCIVLIAVVQRYTAPGAG